MDYNVHTCRKPLGKLLWSAESWYKINNLHLVLLNKLQNLHIQPIDVRTFLKQLLFHTFIFLQNKNPNTKTLLNHMQQKMIYVKICTGIIRFPCLRTKRRACNSCQLPWKQLSRFSKLDDIEASWKTRSADNSIVTVIMQILGDIWIQQFWLPAQLIQRCECRIRTNATCCKSFFLKSIMLLGYHIVLLKQ